MKTAFASRVLGALAPMILLPCLMVGGCASPSPWESSYIGARPEAPLRDAPLPAVRDVSWERLASTRDELEKEVAASDSHPDQWSEDRREASRATLLKGLQVTEDPSRIQVLGRSEFSSTNNIRPDDGTLAAFGASIGASRVIWSSHFLGKADKVVSEPVTTYVTGYDWVRDRKGRHRYEPTSYHTTTWVPVTVRANDYHWVAYFLRDQ